jgi:hypothetical protein
VISDARGCDRLAAALCDLLVEPPSDGGWLGERWFRAFDQARIECVGGIRIWPDAPDLETIVWRGRELRVRREPA